MATTMFAKPIWAFDRKDVAMRQALAAGWRRVDLWWERLQEDGNAALAAGRKREAIQAFRLAHLISRWLFDANDPRRAAGYANAAFAARLSGAERRAERHYAKARRLWANAPAFLETMQIRPRARSSLFHLRMEVKHWQTYQANMKTRLNRFLSETEDALEALANREPSPHRLYARWRGEKPAVFDDTRKLLSASLLIASEGSEPADLTGLSP
ncbi:MAG: tetratricopeptide repeat-containing protein [Alphaproteobacteria bacterium]